MSKRFITSACVIGVLILLSIWAFFVSSGITEKIKSAPDDLTLSDEEIKVDQLVIVETKEGQKLWEIYADSGHYDNASNQVQLKSVMGNFYKNKKVVMSFKSPVAVYTNRNKEVKLTGGAKAATDSDIHISANELGWSGTKDQLTAKGNVKIRQSDKLLTVGDSSIFSSDFSNCKMAGHVKTSVYSKN